MSIHLNYMTQAKSMLFVAANSLCLSLINFCSKSWALTSFVHS